jgi:hypothetical protein
MSTIGIGKTAAPGALILSLSKDEGRLRHSSNRNASPPRTPPTCCVPSRGP